MLYDLKSSESSLESSELSDNILYENNYSRPLYYENLIENVHESLKKSLSECYACHCEKFDVTIKYKENSVDSNTFDTKSVETKSIESKNWETSSEASSALESLEQLRTSEKEKLINAAKYDYRHTDVNNDSKNLTIKKASNESRKSKKSLNALNNTKKYSNDSTSIENFTEKSQLHLKTDGELFFKFTLPPKFESLINLTPLEYLEQYCWISDGRTAFYTKHFNKAKESKDGMFTLQPLKKLLNAVLMNTLSDKQIESVFELLDLDESSIIKPQQVLSICALTERLFFISNLCDDPESAKLVSKEYQETVDFSIINYKLNFYNINEPLMCLLETIEYSMLLKSTVDEENSNNYLK